MTTETITVGLSARAYDIHIGANLLDRADTLLRPHMRRLRTVIVTDQNVAHHQSARLESALKAAGVECHKIVLKPGEATKTFSELETLTGQLLDLGVERDDLIIALGGGVIGDLTGFAAAILRRGCRFAQIPTSLLAQVDSAVGGKTAINVAQGKNLIGVFHQPVAVIADVTTLDTLPERELRAGYAEVIKYGLIGDEPFFAWLEKNASSLLGGDPLIRQTAVKTACEMKARIVESDEFEKGARALLNLGHTFGHALETALGYSETLLHGEAVAVGMAFAFEFSALEGLCPQPVVNRVKAHLSAVGLPSSLQAIKGAEALDADALFTHMMQDKKVEAGKLTLILARDIGDVFVSKDANAEAVRRFLKTKTSQ